MERSSAQTVTLTNSIIGVGVLSMPFCFQKCGIILSLVLLLLSTYITRLVCSYMIKSAIISRRKNFEQIAFYAFGSFGKLLVELCVVCYLLGTCVAYFVVVGDLGPQITAKILSINESSTLRLWVMIVVTLVCIVPLGLLRNVDSLASVCTASLGFYLCLVLKVMAESGEQISKAGWYNGLALWDTSGILQCLPIFSMALSCQMQLFEVYATMPTSSLDKMSRVIQKSTNFCACIYALIGFFGYVAYSGLRFSGNILINFSPSFVSDIIKIGFVLSVAFSFPLAIFPCRVSLYSLLYKRAYSDTHYYIPESKFRPLTLAIVTVALCLGFIVPSIEVVIGLVGSTIGVAICIIIPAACYMHICKTNIAEKQLAQVMIALGFLIMILGTYANLVAMNHVPEKTYETVVDRKVTLPPVLKVDKMEANLDKPLDDVKLQQPVEPEVKQMPIPTEKPLLHVEELQTVKAVDAQKSDGSKDGVALITPEPPPGQQHKPESKEEIIGQDAILKEEKEIAVEEKEKIQQDISELKSAKKELEAQVQVIKEQLVKTNEETQQLVLKKFDEIVEKIDQKASKDKEPAAPVTVKSEVEKQLPEKAEILNHNKDPIVRLLTEQGKLKAQANETLIEQIEKASPEQQNHSSAAVETKLLAESVNNDLKNDVVEAKKEPLAEKAEPLPPLPVEQKPEPVEVVEEAQKKADVESKKDDDAGAKRDLLAVRSKRNVLKQDSGGGQDTQVEANESGENCKKTDAQTTTSASEKESLERQFKQNGNIIHDLIGKDKLVNMIRSDILMDERKLLRK
ncbi:putative sodium-coupled neutral amino acid transporter 10 [Topomyia yanbarensis]|uniref:putative sodium-coupled neutral amino acid transporter 10 n=1 Tax=Topomyia yanbarensis TaxID=2498891 RepID=UPI00273A9984|nr:putative sodium-coupled neutral amino acid transporter 10 [Topomyia yanbarensis]